MTRDCCICTPGEKICNLFTKSVFTATLWKSYGMAVDTLWKSYGMAEQQLYDDISENLDDWARWDEYGWDDDSEFDFETNKEKLIKKLARLKELIAENEEHFGENYCFL